MSLDSSQLVQAGYNMALLQSSDWSLQGTRGVRGGLLLYRDHLNSAGFSRQNSRVFEVSTPGSRHGAPLGVLHRRSQRRCTGRISSTRKDYGNISSLERLVRRTVKSEDEQEQKEEGTKEELPNSGALTPAHTQLQTSVAIARGVLMTARIFMSMMTWVTLFFMASVWDGDSQSFKDPGNKNGKRGPRR